MKIKNMESARGNKVANQFILEGRPAFQSFDGVDIKSGDSFQSYDSMICHKTYDGKVYLDRNTWDYSVTTGKYRNLFLGENKAETEKKIKSGEYTLVDLN